MFPNQQGGQSIFINTGNIQTDRSRLEMGQDFKDPELNVWQSRDKSLLKEMRG